MGPPINDDASCKNERVVQKKQWGIRFAWMKCSLVDLLLVVVGVLQGQALGLLIALVNITIHYFSVRPSTSRWQGKCASHHRNITTRSNHLYEQEGIMLRIQREIREMSYQDGVITVLCRRQSSATLLSDLPLLLSPAHSIAQFWNPAS